MSEAISENLGSSKFRLPGVPGDGGPRLGMELSVIAGLISFPVVFQCKRWQTISVGPATVRELSRSDGWIRADKGLLITTGSFTRDRQTGGNFAEGVQPIDLIACRVAARTKTEGT